MTRKFSRNSLLRSRVFFIAMVAFVSVAALGQVAGLDQEPGQNSLFMPAVFYDTGGGAFSVAVADVNGDGKLDLVVANTNSWTVGVLLGNGDGTFQTASTFRAGAGWPIEITVGDLNGDGKPDIVLTAANADKQVIVMMGNGDGTFQAPVFYDAAAFNPYQPVIADVNGDGKPDIVVADESLVSVLLGNGDGTFQAPLTFGTGWYYGHSVAVADVNGDGKPDLVVTNGNGVGVLLGNGDGTFQAAKNYSTGGQAFWVAVGDINGDGKPDIVASNESSTTIGVLINKGDGTFGAPVTYSSGGSWPWGITLADVNGDGKPDIVVANSGSGLVGVLLGNGDGTFQAPLTYASGDSSLSVAVADVNGDGRPDLLVANQTLCPCWNDGGVALLLSSTGPRSATTTFLSSSANPAARGQTVTYTATVKSEGGGAATGSVTILDGSNTVAIVGLVGNQAQWSTSYPKTGTHTMTSQYPGDADNTGSTSSPLIERVAILPVPSRTLVGTSGSPTFVGQPVTFTATVSSIYGPIPDGELVTFYDGLINVGAVALASGTATYTTSSLSAKTHTIKAAYAGDATYKPSSGKVTQVVNKYPTTTTISSSPNPSQFGQRVTFTAQVTSSGPTPTGMVRFMDGTATLGSAKLSGGIAILKRTTLTVGTHAITAEYLSDAANAVSTSPVLNQVVE